MLDKQVRRRLEDLAERNEKMAAWPTGQAHCTAQANAQIAADIRAALAECDKGCLRCAPRGVRIV